MSVTQPQAHRADPAGAAASMMEKGYFVFSDVLTDAEIKELRSTALQFFRTGGRSVAGGGQKQGNAAFYVPAIGWLFHHPRVLACFREALGTDSIMFTNHAGLQKDVLGGWHKDDGTEDAMPNNTGDFSRFAYDLDDCRVYRMAVYLQNHDRDRGGLWVREGSHRFKSQTEGPARYIGPRAGSVILFDVRATHSGPFLSTLQRRFLQLRTLLPQRYVDGAFAKARKFYRTARGRERISIFFNFGLPNEHTIESAKNNLRRQLLLTPEMDTKLASNLRKAFESNHVLLAEDHFTL